jgi:hypothetical protein
MREGLPCVVSYFYFTGQSEGKILSLRGRYSINIKYHPWQSHNKKRDNLFLFSHVIPMKMGIQSFFFHLITNNFFFKKEGFYKNFIEYNLCVFINQNGKITNRDVRKMFKISN